MKLLDCFPTTIAEIDLNLSQNEILSYINHIKSSDFKLHALGFSYTNNQKLLEDNIFVNLKNTFLDLSRNYLNSIEQIFEDIQVSSSWGVICPPNTQSDVHNHTNAFISGCFYLTNGSPIHFVNPLTRLWFFQNDLNIESNTFRGAKYVSFTPTPGKLLLFPAWLEHEIISNNEPERISLAFNIIPKGEFGFDSAKLYL